ncbi:MAG TPA: 1-acyl-sn-glycerol-3-phosphate acyltransferase, partial [Paracoccaceae bacterium]|nr:1-acyl-sn-glycerol-3-phosphate acyltransferase [Paracoccaceae bacterium]
ASGYVASFVAPLPVLQKFLKLWGTSAQFGVRNILGSEIEIRGREYLPTAHPPLIAAKHQSELDVLVMVSQHPDMTTVAMRELTKFPFFGRILRVLDYVTVQLSGPPENRTREVIEGARRAHLAGRPVVIYPEGTLMSLGAKERYRAGIWHIYNDLQIPVTPVAMSLGVIWPRREWVKFPKTRGAFEYLPPIAPGLDREEFLATLEHQVETATMRLIEEHAEGDMLSAARDRFARGVANEDMPWQSSQHAARKKTE